MPTNVIDNFSGQYSFLSNFYRSAIFISHTWPTVEHYFQAMKSMNPMTHLVFLEPSVTPGRAKRMGRDLIMRPDWDKVKVSFMTEAVFAKFDQHPDLAKQLAATGDATLIEGNTWGDRYWGVCGGTGKNMLGRILMLVRASL